MNHSKSDSSSADPSSSADSGEEASSDGGSRKDARTSSGAPAGGSGGAEAGKRSFRRRRIEPPVLVIESAGETPRRPSGQDAVSRNLEAMVQDLMRKLREAEDGLKERDQAIGRLQEQTVAMARRLDGTDESGPGQMDLEALDLFGPASRSAGRPAPAAGSPARGVSPEKLAKAARESRNVKVRTQQIPVPSAGQSAGAHRACPGCSQALRKARCASVVTFVCLACHGVFLENRSVRQLARSQSWFRFVARFLGKKTAAPRTKA